MYKTNNTLRAVFNESNLTQIEFSRITKTSKNSVSDWLQDKFQIQFSRLEELLFELDINIKIITNNKMTEKIKKVKLPAFKEITEAKKRLEVFKKLNAPEVKINKLKQELFEIEQRMFKTGFKTNNTLIKLVQELGFSQVDLSKATGKQEHDLSKWINSKSQLKFSNLEEIAKSLGCEIEIVITKKTM